MRHAEQVCKSYQRRYGSEITVVYNVPGVFQGSLTKVFTNSDTFFYLGLGVRLDLSHASRLSVPGLSVTGRTAQRFAS